LTIFGYRKNLTQDGSEHRGITTLKCPKKSRFPMISNTGDRKCVDSCDAAL